MGSLPPAVKASKLGVLLGLLVGQTAKLDWGPNPGGPSPGLLVSFSMPGLIPESLLAGSCNAAVDTEL